MPTNVPCPLPPRVTIHGDSGHGVTYVPILPWGPYINNNNSVPPTVPPPNAEPNKDNNNDTMSPGLDVMYVPLPSPGPYLNNTGTVLPNVSTPNAAPNQDNNSDTVSPANGEPNPYPTEPNSYPNSSTGKSSAPPEFNLDGNHLDGPAYVDDDLLDPGGMHDTIRPRETQTQPSKQEWLTNHIIHSLEHPKPSRMVTADEAADPEEVASAFNALIPNTQWINGNQLKSSMQLPGWYVWFYYKSIWEQTILFMRHESPTGKGKKSSSQTWFCCVLKQKEEPNISLVWSVPCLSTIPP